MNTKFSEGKRDEKHNPVAWFVITGINIYQIHDLIK